MFTPLTLATALLVGAPALKDKTPEGRGPGYMGITFQKDAGGLVVKEVKADGPAARAGLRADDLIVRLDDVDMAEAETGELVKMVSAMRPGTVVSVEIKRGSQALTLKVKLAARPPDFTPTPRLPPTDDDPRP